MIHHRYPLSPFAQKISFVLLFKKINYKLVDVSRAPPRPQLADELGIKYRRIPVLVSERREARGEMREGVETTLVESDSSFL